MPEKSEQMSSGNDGDESGGAAVRRGVHRRRVPRSAHPRPPDGPVGVHLAWAWFVPLISAVHTRQQHRPVAIRVPPACSSRHRMNSTCSRRVCSPRYAYARLSTSRSFFLFLFPPFPFPPFHGRSPPSGRRFRQRPRSRPLRAGPRIRTPISRATVWSVASPTFQPRSAVRCVRPM